MSLLAYHACGQCANLYSANHLVAFVGEHLKCSCAAAISVCTKRHTHALDHLPVQADSVHSLDLFEAEKHWRAAAALCTQKQTLEGTIQLAFLIGTNKYAWIHLVWSRSGLLRDKHQKCAAAACA